MSRTDWRSGLLVSVRDPAEAAVAVAAGALIIDVKEPSLGPLGRADAGRTVEILAAAAGRAVVTLACGELAGGVSGILAHVEEVLGRLPAGVPGPVAAKAGPATLGLAAWRAGFHSLSRGLPQGVEPVAVAYADWRQAAAPAPEAIFAAAQAEGCRTFLVDTCDKSGPGLFATVPQRRLQAWISAAAAAGGVIALAGRLSPADVAAGFALGADVCGVRTAACAGGRHGAIVAPRVRSLATLQPPRPGWAAIEPRGVAES